MNAGWVRAYQAAQEKQKSTLHERNPNPRRECKVCGVRWNGRPPCWVCGRRVLLDWEIARGLE